MESFFLGKRRLYVLTTMENTPTEVWLNMSQKEKTVLIDLIEGVYDALHEDEKKSIMGTSHLERATRILESYLPKEVSVQLTGFSDRVVRAFLLRQRGITTH